MANQITLTEADYKAINEFLEDEAARLASYGDSGYFDTDESNLHLENGMALCIFGRYEAETTCTDRGDYYTPPCYRTDISLNIEDICALDAEDNVHPIQLGWGKVKTHYSFD